MNSWYTCPQDGCNPPVESTPAADRAPIPRQIKRPRSKPKLKGGALTRAERTRKLRKRPGYGGIQLVPGGIVITCRASDGYVNLAEILAAEADARGGKPKRLNDWMRLKTTPGYLEAVGLAAGIPADSLLDRGDGQDPWAHHEVACEIAAWLSPELRLAINRLWLETVNGRRRRPAADPALLAARRGSQRPLTDVLAAAGMDRAGIVRFQRQLAYEVTGKTPKAWREELGPNWLDQQPPATQAALAISRRAAAAACAGVVLDPVEGGFHRHYNRALKAAVAPVKLIAPVLAQLPPAALLAIQGEEVPPG
ncbi:KilA-N domain-containing protein [Synechococcus sp. CCAP 1479/9]|uniref:KilA-N domain-containing protein n=1 Tax=Synechococcus sp. CCAP 1479/9 TaxID=1221593 RepID=UPI00256FF69B|nr:KilA-N domain-containing protein [Synechococcus sp. CCAP 1479/9]